MNSSSSQRPPWLDRSLRKLGRIDNAPHWSRLDNLPPLHVGGYQFTHEEMQAVITALGQSKYGQIHPFLAQVARAVTGEVVAKFCWELSVQQRKKGQPVDFERSHPLIGVVAYDPERYINEIVRVFRKLVTFPNKNQAAIAHLVEALYQMERPSALFALLRMRYSCLNMPIRLPAEIDQLLAQTAVKRNWRYEQLLLRIVPEYGLAPDDPFTLTETETGAQYTLQLTADMEPKLRGRDGRFSTEPADLSDGNRVLWTAKQQELTQAKMVQAWLLERGMVEQWRWSWEDFGNLICKHPYLQHVAQLVVWGVYDRRGRLRQSFRLADDLSFADELDNTAAPGQKAARRAQLKRLLPRFVRRSYWREQLQEVPGAAERLTNTRPPSLSVGVVHPLQLTAEQRDYWRELFDDYELLPLFPQMWRKLEDSTTVPGIDTFEDQFTLTVRDDLWYGMYMSQQNLFARLLSFEWRMEGMGTGAYLVRHFSGLGVTAVLQPRPGGVKPPHAYGFFVRERPSDHLHQQERLKLTRLEPLVLAETLRDIGRMLDIGSG